MQIAAAGEGRKKILHPPVKRPVFFRESLVVDTEELIEGVFDDFFQWVGCGPGPVAEGSPGGQGGDAETSGGLGKASGESRAGKPRVSVRSLRGNGQARQGERRMLRSREGNRAGLQACLDFSGKSPIMGSWKGEAHGLKACWLAVKSRAARGS